LHGRRLLEVVTVMVADRAIIAVNPSDNLG